MIEAYSDLTWQFQLLVLEPFLSVGIALAMCAGLGGQRRPNGFLPFGLVWNAVVLALFVFGGATTSWQHWLYLGWVLLDCVLLVVNRDRRVDRLDSAAAIGALIVVSIPLALLLTGV